jgi:hypothetical protein
MPMPSHGASRLTTAPDQDALKMIPRFDDALGVSSLQPVTMRTRKALERILLTQVTIQQIAMNHGGHPRPGIQHQQHASIVVPALWNVLNDCAIDQPKSKLPQLGGRTHRTEMHGGYQLRKLPGNAGHRSAHLRPSASIQQTRFIIQRRHFHTPSTVTGINIGNRKAAMGARLGPTMDSLDATRAFHRNERIRGYDVTPHSSKQKIWKAVEAWT